MAAQALVQRCHALYTRKLPERTKSSPLLVSTAPWLAWRDTKHNTDTLPLICFPVQMRKALGRAEDQLRLVSAELKEANSRASRQMQEQKGLASDLQRKADQAIADRDSAIKAAEEAGSRWREALRAARQQLDSTSEEKVGHRLCRSLPCPWKRHQSFRRYQPDRAIQRGAATETRLFPRAGQSHRQPHGSEEGHQCPTREAWRHRGPGGRRAADGC